MPLSPARRPLPSTGSGARLTGLVAGTAARAPVAVASPRARLLDAMARTTAAKGYAQATVADAVERSGVSRRAFYDAFVDKEACFLAAFEAGAAEAMDAMTAAAQAARPEERTRAGLGALLAALAAEPALTRLFVVDVAAAGPRATALRRALLGRFAQRLGALAPAGSNPGPEMLHALAGGIDALVADHVAEHGAASLGRLAPALERLAHALLR